LAAKPSAARLGSSFAHPERMKYEKNCEIDACAWTWVPSIWGRRAIEIIF
jgi:hypothetical protein